MFFLMEVGGKRDKAGCENGRKNKVVCVFYKTTKTAESGGDSCLV